MSEMIVTLGDSVVSRYVFDKDIVSIGRSRDNDVVIENLAVSRNHARIRHESGRYFVSDLNSANGTFVNGVQVTRGELFHGDVIAIGKHKITFKCEALSDKALISDAFGADRTVIVSRMPVGYLRVVRGKQKDKEFRIDKAETTIGRGKDCSICLQDWFIGKEHAIIQRQGETFVLRDAGSWRGTKVNDESITECTLKNGDEIQIGGIRFVFRIAEEDGAPVMPKRAYSEPGKVSPPQPGPPELPAAGKKPSEVFAVRGEEPAPAGVKESSVKSPKLTPLDFLREEEKAEPEALFPDLETDLGLTPEPVTPAVTERAVVVPSASAPGGVGAEPRRETPKPLEPPTEPIAPGAVGAKPTVPSQVSLEEIGLWEEALKNKSPVIRKQAARMLKKMTGRDYDQ